MYLILDLLSEKVSIHAPVKGATRYRGISSKPMSSFNPRAREGRDRIVKAVREGLTWFQSTRP